MTPRAFVRRVAADSALAIGLLAITAAWLGLSGAALGIVLGGALAVGNLWWMAGHAAPAGGLPRPAGLVLSATVRLGVVAAVVAVVFAAGQVHPVGVVVGLTVLPLALILRGLMSGGEA